MIHSRASKAATAETDRPPAAAEKSAYLIDTFPIHFCSIDRLTILGSLNCHVDQLSKIFAQEIEFEPSIPTAFPYRHLIKSVAGFVVMIKDPSAKNIPDLKIDFNPNKFTWSSGFNSILNLMKYRRFTRIDFCVDYPHSLSGYKFLTDVSKKHRSISARNGDLETLDIGIGESGSHNYTIYDKAKEQKIQQETILWRIEHKMRLLPDDDFRSLEPFSDLTIINPEYHAFPNFNDRAALFYLASHPEQWSGLDARKRRRYKSLLKDSEYVHHLYPHPRDCYLKRKNELRAELEYYLTDERK